jgi:hypothetical protein
MHARAVDGRQVGADFRFDLRGGDARRVFVVRVLDPRFQPSAVRMLSTIIR